jgi:hypothetical protein
VSEESGPAQYGLLDALEKKKMFLFKKPSDLFERTRNAGKAFYDPLTKQILIVARTSRLS